jgi:hypothetical protein
MLKKGTGFRICMVASFSGGPELIPHLVDGDGDNLIYLKDRDTPLEISEGVLDTVCASCSILVFNILGVYRTRDKTDNLR